MANRFSRALRYHNARYQDGRDVSTTKQPLFASRWDAFQGLPRTCCFPRHVLCNMQAPESPDEPHEAGKLVNGGPALHEA